MSPIGDLINELCPDGVPYKTVGEVAAYSDSRVDANTLDKTSFVGVDNLLPNKAGKCDANYQPNTVRVTRYEVGDVLLGNIRPYLKKIWLATNAGGCSGDVLAIRISAEQSGRLTPEFLYYMLSADTFFAYNMQNARGSKMPRGNKDAILQYRIPLPPFDIQREIVKILNQFTRLQTELDAELNARRRQFAYYRESLLAFTGSTSVQRVTLGDLGEFVRGNGLQKSDLLDSGVPAIHYGQVHTHYGTWATETKSFVSPDFAIKLRMAKPGDLVIATTSEDDDAVGKAVAWIGSENAAVSGDAYIYRHSLDPKYVAYFFQTDDFHGQKRRSITGTKVRRVSGDALAKVIIPVPVREEQERIVSILDTFHALVNDTSMGIPAELAARRKQYEHYRDRLLTFEEAVV